MGTHHFFHAYTCRCDCMDLHGFAQRGCSAAFSNADVGHKVKITGSKVHVNSKIMNINWGEAKHSSMVGTIKSVDPRYKGKVELEDGQVFENGISQYPRSCAVGDVVWVGKDRAQPATISLIVGSTITVNWISGNATHGDIDACSVTKNGGACGNNCTTYRTSSNLNPYFRLDKPEHFVIRASLWRATTKDLCFLLSVL